MKTPKSGSDEPEANPSLSIRLGTEGYKKFSMVKNRHERNMRETDFMKKLLAWAIDIADRYGLDQDARPDVEVKKGHPHPKQMGGPRPL